MMLWILIAVLTALAALSVLVPMARTRQSSDDQTKTADESVYREQLDAIDLDLERGLIDATAAEAARAETARRLLAAHERTQEKQSAAPSKLRLRLVQGLAIVALPALALGVYLGIGSPGYSDQPLQARLNAPAENQSVEVLVARVERHLTDNPEDGKGWAIIAPVYFSIGQLQQSVQAYANALRLLGPNPEYLTNMGEALTVANQGVVPQKARTAFEKAVELEPAAVKPRFFLALGLGQEGKTDDAIKAWSALLEGADPAAAWVPAARSELAKLTGSETELPGPSAEDMAAAQELSQSDQQEMIRGMVSGLADRLNADGGSPQEWSRLMRAYMVLGEKDKAVAALKQAEQVFSEKPEDLARIKDAASQMGLSGT